MSEYIEVDAFKREMYHEAFETDTDMQRWDSGCWIRYKLFEEILNKQPTADVRENVHGKWRRRLVDSGFNADWVCSCCGHRVMTDFVNYNFCPNCGADMREGENNG